MPPSAGVYVHPKPWWPAPLLLLLLLLLYCAGNSRGIAGGEVTSVRRPGQSLTGEGRASDRLIGVS